MARERATINIDIWSDADFRNLTAAAQSLYFKLTSHPKLDYCGVTEFHPGRLAAMSLEQSGDDVMIAAQELSDKYFLVIDQSTDEVMVRAFLRWDGLLKQPRLAVSAAKAYGAIASNKLRAVVVHELQRFRRENPDLAAWEKPQVKTVLRQPATSVRETETGLSWAFSVGGDWANGQRYGQRSDETLGDAMTGPTTTTATTTATSTSSKEDADNSGKGSPQGSTSRKRKSDKAAGEGCSDHLGYPLPCDRCAESAVA